MEFGVSNEVPFCSIIVSRFSLTTMFSILHAELLKELSKSSFSAKVKFKNYIKYIVFGKCNPQEKVGGKSRPLPAGWYGKNLNHA